MKQFFPKKSFPPSLIIFISVVMLLQAPLAMEVYAPSLPAMVQAFNATPRDIQLTMIVYLAAVSVAQIILRIMADHYGRRRLLLSTMPLLVAGSLMIVCANTLTTVLVGRVIQGVGAGICAASARAILTDAFEGPELNRGIAYLMTAYTFFPITLPLIGGFIQQSVGWRGNFIFILLASGIAYLFFVFKLPETYFSKDTPPLDKTTLIKNYGAVLTHKTYLFGVLINALMWSMMMVFSLVGPFLIQSKLGESAIVYGYLATTIGMGFFIGTRLNHTLLKATTSDNLMRASLLICLLFSIILETFISIQWNTTWAVMSPIFFMMIGVGVGFPHFYAAAISAVPEHPAIAHALISPLILISSVMIAGVVVQFNAYSFHTLGFVYVAISTVCCVIYCLNTRDIAPPDPELVISE